MRSTATNVGSGAYLFSVCLNTLKPCKEGLKSL